MWGEFLVAVGKDRKLTPTQLQNLADNQAILEAESAVQQKLATKIAYEDEMISQLQQLGQKDEESFRKVSLKAMPKLQIKSYSKSANQK